jgi:protein involved in polysaccharide export with SLBB domain
MREMTGRLLWAMLLLLLTLPLGAQARVTTLQPGDGIRLRVIGADEVLSGEFTVDERLIVVLPKLGEWSVAGVPADSIRPRLLRALGEFLVTPSIEVTPYRRVAITGEVLKPGLYPVDAGMSVGDAVILASGTKPEAKEGVVERRRLGARKGSDVPLEVRVWDLGLLQTEQLVVPRRSWFSRNGFRTLTTIVSLTGSVAWVIVLLTQ